jgi:hypothetical protein
VIADIVTLLGIAVWMQIASTAILTSAAGVAAFLIGRLACLTIARAYHRRSHHGPHDVGPDALRLLQELDVHLDQIAAHDPQLAAGFQQMPDTAHNTRKEAQ